MSTLDALGLTPAHLTPAAPDLVFALRQNSCAWKVRRGWKPKRGERTFQAVVGDSLVGRLLATIQISGRGPQRLVLTTAGEQMAALIKDQRNAAATRAYRKKVKAA